MRRGVFLLLFQFWLLLNPITIAYGNETHQNEEFKEVLEWKSSVVANEYIVMFKSYMKSTEHNETVTRIVGGEGWKIRPRNNPSSIFPTDFAVLMLDPSYDEKVLLEKLKQSDQVKYVIPQRKFTNILSEAFEDPEHDNNDIKQYNMKEEGLDYIKEEEKKVYDGSLNQSDQNDENDDSTRKSRKSTKSTIQDSHDFSQDSQLDDLIRRLNNLDSDVEILHRQHTKFAEEEEFDLSSTSRRRLKADPTQIPHLFNAQLLWDEGFSGKGVKVAVFDTGLEKNHPHFRNVVSRTDWTDEGTREDVLGHGTFVTGVIASDRDCLGFAPDVDIYSFRVFTANRVSYTAWFLDAFNFAIQKRINILNLSIGGPDFLDRPFVEKVWEMSANKIIVVSAIGNDGPIYGTLNNPADHLDVIGVGGIDFKDQVASFSSRGMTTWELPRGSGRVKPDIMAYGQAVQGSGIGGGCKTLSGTSVASPVIAGAVALLASSVPEPKRWQILNPASIKQVLLAGAREIPNANIYEQGAGKLDLIESYSFLSTYTPRVTFFPASLDFTDCPYMWPYCTQPLFYGAIPTIFNVTILNGLGSSGVIVGEPKWIPAANGDMLEVSFTHSEYLWPWSGWLGLHLRVSSKAAKWQGTTEGMVEITVQSPPVPPETTPRLQTVRLPLKANIVPSPSRAKRVLWDQFHNLRYPSGYLPRDALWIKQEPFDWNGDHPYTNFRDLYNHLRSAGFFIDILGDPYTCFNASNYGTLLIVDPEEEFFAEEIEKLAKDVKDHGLSIAIFADWYNEDVMQKINFFDENTKRMWTPITGGANIPALNDLLSQWGIQFGDTVYDGDISVDGTVAHFASGVAVARFPEGGVLLPFELKDQSAQLASQRTETHPVPILGFYNVPQPKPEESAHPGRIAVFGDSSCLDMAAKSERRHCFWLAKDVLMFTSQAILPSYAAKHKPLSSDYVSKRLNLPKRGHGNQLPKYSKVLGHSPVCLSLEFQRFNQSDSIPTIKWPTKRGPEPSNHLLFREGQSRSRPVYAPRSTYDLIVPFLLGGAVVLVLVVFFLRITKSRRHGSAQVVVPAHL